MIYENRITIGGKVVKDPNFSKTKSGKSVCKVNIIVEKKIGHMNRSDFIPIAMWGKKADIAQDRIRKGDSLVVCGSIAQERWETKEHERRSRIVVQAEKFWIIPSEHYNYEEYEDEADEAREGREPEECEKGHEEYEEEVLEKSAGMFDGMWSDEK